MKTVLFLRKAPVMTEQWQQTGTNQLPGPISITEESLPFCC